MRYQLMQAFTCIYILNLHGNTKFKETPPTDVPVDENVFDIQEGDTIGIFIKEAGKKGPAQVYYADLWGRRVNKYNWLLEKDVQNTEWEQLEPEAPYYLFVKGNVESSDYKNYTVITDIFPTSSMGIATARDRLTVNWTIPETWQTVTDFVSLPTEVARDKYSLGKDKRDWEVNLAQKDIKSSGPSFDKVTPITYRPFDIRFTYYTGRTKGFICMPRREVMHHLKKTNNIAMCFIRGSREEIVSNFYVARHLVDKTIISSADNAAVAPIYLYPSDETTRQKGLFDTSPWPPGPNGRTPNLSPDLVAGLEQRLNLTFIPDGTGDLTTSFGPEDIFHYIYAVFYSPTYRDLYAESLIRDFPRVPLTSDLDLFRTLCGLGRELVALHLLEGPSVGKLITRYPIANDDVVEKDYPKYLAPGEPEPGKGQPLAVGRVYINKTQYFEGIAPEVWDFQIGGYQVLDKWLKDRRGRKLSYDDLTHYQQVVVALKETIRLMEEIDQAIPDWPIE